ncbi:MAG: RagB/SusD family nutrient uptake outer membrane protein [Muribaculaceae bacterium]|nr:RagB/SusD family nutrient uptake outer membrane protein [Muribaculaceae bacterium]
MKKIIYSTLTLLMLLVASCTDDLNQRPVAETDAETVYSEAANYKMVLAKLYASFVIAGQESGGGNADISSNNGYDFLRCYFNLQEGATDEMAATWLEGDKMEGLSYMSWDANDPWVADTYYRLYYTIAMCNELIRHSSDSEISKFTAQEQTDIKSYKAEARFLRALSYYYVLDSFGQGPYVDETMSVVAFVPEAYTNKQLFAYIESELKDNVENDLSDPSVCEYGRASKAAAWALLAKMYLNAEVYTGEGRYTDCITYCKKVIGAGYSLEKDYSKLFNASNELRTNEIIFPFVLDCDNIVSWGATTYIICGECGNSSSQDPTKYGLTSGWGMFRVRGELPAKFGDVASSTDSRCLFYTDGQSQWLDKAIDNQTLGYFGEKFSNLKDDGTFREDRKPHSDTDYPVFRLADVYLMVAESVIRGGSGYSRSDALDFLNRIRERAYGDASGNINDSQMDLQYIIDERAREMYWECTRRTDLIRFNQFTGGNYIWQWKGGVPDGRSTNARYNVFPIPTAELRANPNLNNANY